MKKLIILLIVLPLFLKAQPDVVFTPNLDTSNSHVFVLSFFTPETLEDIRDSVLKLVKGGTSWQGFFIEKGDWASRIYLYKNVEFNYTTGTFVNKVYKHCNKIDFNSYGITCIKSSHHFKRYNKIIKKDNSFVEKTEIISDSIKFTYDTYGNKTYLKNSIK